MKNLQQKKKIVKNLMKIYQNKKRNQNHHGQVMVAKRMTKKTVSHPLIGNKIFNHNFLNQTEEVPNGKHG